MIKWKLQDIENEGGKTRGLKTQQQQQKTK